MRNDRYLIEDKPMKGIFLFAFPLMIGNFFQQTYTMVDSMVVGRYVGTDALAAIGASYAFTNIFVWFALGGGIGASVVVSRYFGEKSYRKMKTALYTSLIDFLVVSILLAILGLFIGRGVLTLLRTPGAVLDEAMIYLNIYFCGLPFLFMYNVVASMFNSIGKSRIPLYFLIFSSVFNIVLDVILVKYVGLGIAGVAIATFAAQGLSVLLSFGVLLRVLVPFYNEKPHEKVALFSMSETISMAKIAIPSILQQGTVAVGMMMVQSVINTFGAEALAGYAAAARVENFVAVPWISFNNAMSTYTAQNIGAGRKERVHEGLVAVYKMITIISAIYFVLLRVFAGSIMRVFLGIHITPMAYAVGTGYVSFLGLCSYMLGYKQSVDGLLRGAADTKAFTIANFVNLGLRVFIAFTFAPIFGVEFVWYGSPVGWFANWAISYGHYRKTEWRRL